MVRIKSAGKEVAIGKSRAVIGWKRIAERASFVYYLSAVQEFFCQQRAGLELLIKVTSEADRWKQNGKSFTKNWFLNAFFPITKNVFHYYLQSFFLPNPDACDLQPAVLNFAAYGHELLVQFWHLQQAVWRFMVILSLPLPNNTVQTFWGVKDSSLGRFLFMVCTSCCKYSKSNV